MTFLPIVERELRIRARRKSTFRSRLAGAAAASLFIGVFLLFHVGTGTTGTGVFIACGGVAFLYCLFEGGRNRADSLGEEKRQGSLGLLFLTDLKGYDVVLGKLVATSLNS